MAKVIEHGNLYNKTVACKSCGCKFIAEKEDIVYPVINIDDGCDDGEVHIDVLKEVPGLTKKNETDKFYIKAEIYEYRAPYIMCPECGETIGQRNELILFDDRCGNQGDEIFVTDDYVTQKKLEAYDYGSDELEEIIKSYVYEGTYECYCMVPVTNNYKRINIPIKRILKK